MIIPQTQAIPNPISNRIDVTIPGCWPRKAAKVLSATIGLTIGAASK
jgi:hypothetical protein